MPKKQPRQDETAQQPSFEESLEQLEVIVRRLESGELGLDEALKEYERGVGLLRTCRKLLDRAQARIELLTRVDEDGTPVTEPFGEADMSLDEKSQRRSARRSYGTQADAPDTDTTNDDETGD